MSLAVLLSLPEPLLPSLPPCVFRVVQGATGGDGAKEDERAKVHARNLCQRKERRKNVSRSLIEKEQHTCVITCMAGGKFALFTCSPVHRVKWCGGGKRGRNNDGDTDKVKSSSEVCMSRA